MTESTPLPPAASPVTGAPDPPLAAATELAREPRMPDAQPASVLARPEAEPDAADRAATAAATDPPSPQQACAGLRSAHEPATADPKDPLLAAAPAATPPDTPSAPGPGLVVRTGADGSFSLWSEAFGEGFHSGRGALREAHETFLNPSELQRFQPGSTIQVLEVCAGTGCNLAVLLEACGKRGLRLDWTGLELDPEPLRLAMGQPAFRAPWQPATLQVLEQLQRRGAWAHSADSSAGILTASPPQSPGGGGPPVPRSHGRMLWGDARLTLQQLRQQATGRFDLIWHDAFSPQRCPQLWSLECLGDLAQLLRPDGRWISYSSAAAVREALQQAGLHLAALRLQPYAVSHGQVWSGGTIASPGALPPSGLWRQLSAMELDHLACSAGEPYRDPSRAATAAQMVAARQQAQAEALAIGSRGSSSAWRRRWGVLG